MVVSSSGLATACFTASSALSSPLALPIPICAIPLSFITVWTSAKSRLIRCRHVDQVGNTLNCLLQYLVCLLQCFRHCGSTVYDLQAAYRSGLRSGYPHFLSDVSIPASALFIRVLCLKTERLCNNANRQNAHVLLRFRLPPELRRYRYRRPYRR